MEQKKTPFKCRMIAKVRSKLRIAVGGGQCPWYPVGGALQTLLCLHILVRQWHH